MARFGRSYIKLGLVRPVRLYLYTGTYGNTDSEGLTDSTSFAQTMTLTISDSMGLTDNRSFAQTGAYSKSDAMGLTDSMNTVLNPVEASDALGLTDVMTLTDGESFSEALGLTDSLAFTQGYVSELHSSYHSSGFGELFIDRIYLVEKEKVTEGNDAKLTVAGQESSPPSSFALVTFLHGQIVGMQEGKLIPVTFTDKDERDGYYEVSNVTSDLTNYQNSDAVMADWNIELKRLGSDAEVDLQSRLTGAVRQNDFSLTGTRWHAPAVGHYAYYTGSTSPSYVDRETSDGNISVYLNVPSSVSPKWGCTPTNYRGGRARIFDSLEVSSENEIEGINRNISPTGWSLFNGLINLQATSSAGIVNVAYYDGASFIDNYWRLQRGFVELTQWDSATVIRNDYEQCIIRLVCKQAMGAGRTTVDFSLKRGSRIVEGYMQNSSSTSLKILPVNTTASTSGSGYQVATSGTHRVACGSARTFTVDNTNGGIYKTSTTTFDFWIGPVINAASPQTGDSVTELRDQYIGSMPEIVYAVRR